MLYAPLVLGVAVAGRVSWPVLLLWIAVTALFIGRDRFVAWARARARGRTAPEHRGALACGAAVVLSGAPLILVYDLTGLVLFAALATVMLGANVGLAVRRQERTAAGELLAIAGLTSTAAAAHYVAGRTLEATAFRLWGLSALYFASSVFHVKLRVLALQARRARERQAMRRNSIVYHASLTVLLSVLVLARALPPLVPLAFTPVVARAAWQLIRPTAARNLTRVGMLEIAYSLGFLLFTWLAHASS